MNSFKSHEKQTEFDVAIIGGGPAGITACLELSKSSQLMVVLFERERDLGGVPRSCHVFFGMRDRKRIYKGPTYARKLDHLARKTSAKIETQATVLRINVGSPGEPHEILVVSPDGLRSYKSRFVILATGCFEASRQARFIPGTRPAGVFTTGSLQRVVNLQHQKPGKRALVIGSGKVALSSVMTLKAAGASVVGMVEEDSQLQTYPLAVKGISLFYRFPIYKATELKSIFGHERVEGVELMGTNDQKPFQIECDTVLITGKFHPDSQLLDTAPIGRDPLTSGPLVDMSLMTTVPNIFAAGNVLRGGDMHDLCALEGRMAAQTILRRLQSAEHEPDEVISIQTESPIRYVVPQKITPSKIKSHLFRWLFPGYSIQLERTLSNPCIEAWSGDGKIWEGSFRRLFGNSRISLPVDKFDWDRVDGNKGITLKVQSAKKSW